MQNSLKKSIIERIGLLRNQHTGSRGKRKFAHLLGISASAYSYYENNRVPPIEVLLKICELTGADLRWLLTGKEIPKKTASEAKYLTVDPDSTLLRKLDIFLNENPDLAEPVLAFIELLCEKKGLEKNLQFKTIPSSFPANSPQKKPYRQGWIPVLGRTAAGMVHFWEQTALPEPKQAVTELDELVEKHIGRAIISSADGTLSVDLQLRLLQGLGKPEVNLIQLGGQPADNIVEFVRCEQLHQLFPDSFALRLDGDSMSPRINDGDIVILSPSVPAAEGHIAIARLADQIGVTCKLIRATEDAVHLIPINEKYQTKIVAKKDLLWALAVLCHIRL